MAIHPQGGSWCATVQMLITGATLANWQSPIQRLHCACVPSSKSRACVSLLVPDVDWFSGSPRWPLFHNCTFHPSAPTRLSFHVNRQWWPKPKSAQARPGVQLLCGPLTGSHPDPLHHYVSPDWESILLDRSVLFTPTTGLTVQTWVWATQNLNCQCLIPGQTFKQILLFPLLCGVFANSNSWSANHTPAMQCI